MDSAVFHLAQQTADGSDRSYAEQEQTRSSSKHLPPILCFCDLLVGERRRFRRALSDELDKKIDTSLSGVHLQVQLSGIHVRPSSSSNSSE